MQKYNLLQNDTKVVDGVTLYRVQYLINIERYNVVANSLGGYIQEEANLSLVGDCCVLQNACVYNQGMVTENACVSGSAMVYNSGWVGENAIVNGNNQIHDKAAVKGNVLVKEFAEIYDRAVAEGDLEIGGTVKLYNNAYVSGTGLLTSNLQITTIN